MSEPDRVGESEEKVVGVSKSRSEMDAPSTSPNPNLVLPLTNHEETVPLRRSRRERQPTEKAQQPQDLEYSQLMRRINTAYESWRQCAAEARKEIKNALTIDRLQELHADLKKAQDRVVATYELLKRHRVTEKSVVAKVDNCCTISEDLLEVLLRRRLESEDELDLKKEKEVSRALKCAHPSVFGDSVSESPSVSSNQSIVSIASMKAKADAEKAERMEKAKALQNEQQQRSKILHLQLQMEEEQMKLELMQADAAIRAAEVKCDVLSEAVEHHETHNGSFKLNPTALSFKPKQSTRSSHSSQSSTSHHDAPFHAANEDTSLHGRPPIGETSLAQALAIAMDRNRLPIPTPKVFSGNPIEYVSFKDSFKILVENKGIPAKEKIYYLQQYVAGEAKESIAGCFFGKSEEDYLKAWQTLEKRYGHPFKITEAFRRKLEKWPRVGQRDGPALQKYADFLKSCLDAMPHIKGLSILNDCKENQMMTSKLPDWAISRWSRVVTDTVEKTQDHPTFSAFVEFVDREARVASHPVASLSAVKGLSSIRDVKTNREERKHAGTLATSAESPPIDSNQDVGKIKTCPYCQGEHWLPSCSELASRKFTERMSFIEEQKRCFSCLRTGHFSKQCKSRHVCRKCKGRHPTVLHDDNKDKKSSSATKSQSKDEKASVALKTVSGQASTTNVLPVWISSVNNPQYEKLVYALLDTQSDSTFIVQKICDELGVATDPVKLKLTTMTTKEATDEMSQRVTGLRVRGYTSGQYIQLPVSYTRDFIPLDRDHIPTAETARRWDHLSSIVERMPPLLDCDAGLLIGFNCTSALAPREVIHGDVDEPYGIRTDLGWSVVGRLAPENSDDITGFCHRITVREVPAATPRDVLNVLEKDFEDSKRDISVSQEDIQFLKFLEENTRVNAEGHVEMPLPFRSRPHLPDNRKLACARLAHLKKKLDSQPTYKNHYQKFLDDMLSDGDAERVSEDPRPGETNYIPHHGIYHPKKPDKLRVVFDCSSKYRGTSLNDHLLSGPDLTNGLFGVLCRFRREKVALMCDIQRMFHRFHVKREDRDYLRFLWFEGGDTSKDPVDYRMNVHLFGATSSPGCANFGLKYLSQMHQKEYPLAASFVRQDFYVDDGVTSVESAEKAIMLIQEARELCSLGQLRLHKFISNDRKVVEGIPVSERAAEIQEVDLSKDELPMERTLGVSWEIQSDAFTFQITVKERPNTRRGILSVVGSIYDPLGFVSPFVLEGKAILQEMCKRGSDWDDEISEDLRPRWEHWKGDIPNLRHMLIPRCFRPPDFGPVLRVELHHFSDASTVGYGTCSYLRFIGADRDRVHCSLVVSKARVSPTKVVTVPRLELTAAVVAVKMSMKLKEELQMKIDREYFWCDSQVVLAYISNEARKFHVFVSNRVQIIKENTNVEQWHYIPTKDNPADHASRGLSSAELLTSNWFTGPSFLWKNDDIEVSPIEPTLMVGDPEVRTGALKTQVERMNDLLETFSRFSSWKRLTRTIGRIQCLARRYSRSRAPTVEDIDRAGLTIIRLVQQDAFKEELKILHGEGELPSTSKLFNLNPYLEDGLIRVGGRLRKSPMSLAEKHPLVLPKCHVARLVIAYCHDQIRHQGRGQTINEIRHRGFWILGVSKLVASVIKGCVTCRKLRRPAEEQKMSDLPQDRVDPAPPFLHCGMDYFGPFITKQGRKEYKRYGLLFTCLCSRAVHIDVVEDMTTDAFINALRCFIAIRGTVQQIRSDRGSNFVGAENELKAALNELDVQRISTYLTEKQCTFVFNAPHASHTGGVWERQIKSVRSVLNATLALCPGRLDDASLRCYMYEAMSIINSRPLTPVDTCDPNAEPPLTPNHLITMKPTSPLPPPGNFVREDLYARKRWRRVQYLSQQFWSRWQREYLQNLQKRAKWNTPRRNLKVGDVVLLKDQDAPRLQWPLGVITTANPDDDGLVRRVWVRIGSRELSNKGRRPELERPIQKLVLLVEQD